MADDEGFVRRWSRRKSEARAPEPDPKPQPPAAGEPPEPREAAVAEFDPATLPDIETLTYQSDFTGFLRAGVPLEMRNRALRRLWRSDPVFANLDGLVEYGEDYSKVGMVKEVVRTAYQVGRGMLDRIEAAAAQPPTDSPAAEDHGDAAAPAQIEAPAAIEAAAAIEADDGALAGGVADDTPGPAPRLSRAKP